MKPCSLLSLGFVVLGASLSAKELPPKQALADIDSVIEQALTTFKVPGLALSVVVRDEVVLSKGYGLRDVERKLPMTPVTRVKKREGVRRGNVTATNRRHGPAPSRVAAS